MNSKIARESALTRSWLGCCSCALYLSAALTQAAPTFDEANLLYEQAAYLAAAEAYQEIIAEGSDSAAIRFNLGNALYQQGRVGPSVLAYHQALELAPGDPDIKGNLRFAREKLGVDAVLPRSFWQQFLFQLTLNQWTAVAMVPYWIWLGGTAIALGARNRRSWMLQSAKLSGILFAFLAILLLGATRERLAKQYGVVTEKEAVVRFGPFSESKSSHNVVDGVELMILDEKDGWHQIRDPQGQTGWVRSDQIALLPPLP